MAYSREVDDQLPEQTTIDVVVDVGVAAALGTVAMVPFIGPLVRELIGAGISTMRIERLERFARALADRMQELGVKVDEQHVRGDEYREFVAEVLEEVPRARNARKLEMFASAIAGSATVDRPPIADQERFLDDLEALRVRHLVALERIATDPGTPGALVANAFTVGELFANKRAAALAGVPVDEIDLRDLERRGFLRPMDESGTTALLASDDIRSYVTARGRAFLRYIRAGSDLALADLDLAPARLLEEFRRQGNKVQISTPPDGGFEVVVQAKGWGDWIIGRGPTEDAACRDALRKLAERGLELPA